MFSTHPATLRLRGRSACLVASAHPLLTANEANGWLEAAASLLHARGWAVRVLWCGSGPAQAPAPGLPPGVPVVSLANVPTDPTCTSANSYGPGPADQSDHVRAALEQLHRQDPLDLVLFPALGGLGFRSLQARRAGLGPPTVVQAVCLDGCSAWLRQRQQRWPDCVADLELDFIERYAFEHADLQVGWCLPALEHVHAANWPVRAGFQPLPEAGDLFATALPVAPPSSPALAREDEQPLVTVCVPYYNLGPYLPRALASIAAQTYPRLEVLVLDDGSTDPDAQRVFLDMRHRYPHFRFLTQANAGIGATRNRGLAEARGDYFLPLDADNIACPHLVERLVAALAGRPDLAALTCYFLAFAEDDDLLSRKYLYACRPTGGPRLLASLRNVYGDALALYRTSAFRAVGGYETDRDTSFEDWEAFVKLANAGYGLDVLPEYLFFYRHREGGFSRVTREHANRERVLRQFRHRGAEALAPAEAAALWDALAGFHRKLEELSARQRGLRYRLADRLHSFCRRFPPLLAAARRLCGPLVRGREAV